MENYLKILIYSLMFNVLCIAFAVAGPVPDTGQTTSYTDTFGEDSDYIINPPSYTKLGANGVALSDDATVEDGWIMTMDNVTGLIWEVKQNKDDIQDYNNPNDADNTYTWYDSNPETNYGNAGTPGDGTDTEDFLNTLNSSNFGGFSDWRLPAPKELKSIVNSEVYNPSIDQMYFPKTVSSNYWSSTSHPYLSDTVWCVDFYGSGVSRNNKSLSYCVRAVRGGQPENIAYVDNKDGTVTDSSTGLMWQQTNFSMMTWEAALSYCESLSLAGYSDWRLPNDKELLSIVDYSIYNPSIDRVAFPGTLSSYYWSSTSCATLSVRAWRVHFGDGGVGYYYKSGSYYVRAVRGGQSILVISYPNGGEALYRGYEYMITWQSININEEVSIGLYKGGEDPEHLVLQLASATENDGEFVVTLPNDLEHGHDYYIGISTVSGEIQDFSDASFSTHYPGDINGDQLINLSDALLGLKVVAGISGISDVYIESDVNNDGKIGTDEIVYILKEIAKK